MVNVAFRNMSTPLFILVSLMVLVSRVGGSYPVGDLNADSTVDFKDLRILAEHWLLEICLVPGCEADLDGADGVNAVDLALLAQNWRSEGGSPVISEFMASNGSREPLGAGELLDEDDDSSDWIEIYNLTEGAVDLSGWYLTDDANELTQWELPDGVELEPGAFLVVFASGKNRAAAGSELHTNFRLNADDGSYLALVKRDGVTVAHEYAPACPRQLTDISYGLRQYSRTLIAPGATASYHVPTVADVGTDWTSRSFDDSKWRSGPTGLGFGFGGEPRVAYNDCVYQEGQYMGENVTSYGTGSGFGGLTSGALVDQATGEEIGVTVAFTESGGVNWQPNPGNGGRDAAPGTDAHTTFAGIADMTGVIYYGGVGWWIDLTFAGLDPGTEYTFVTSATRCNYEGRWTVYTLTGADTYVNASTDGVEELAANKVRFNTGDNYNEGYVARWTGITASDGSFTVRAEAETSSTDGLKAYSFDVFMLKGGFSGSDIQEQMLNTSASLWTRIAFNLDDEEAGLFDTLTLRMKYEDGFAAYLNGIEVARDNFTGVPSWDSGADTDRPKELAAGFVNFDISDYIGLLRQGTNVLAVCGLNDDSADPNFLILPELIAASSVGVAQYFVTATPGKFNVPGAIDVVADTKFTRDRGFYETPIEVEIECDTPGATIHYTTDGSAPSETHGLEYAGPIGIGVTTCLRAVAFKPGWISTNVDTHTYIFLDQVIRQPQSPPGFPTSWGGTAADYEMDPDVVNDPRYRGLMKDSLLSLPTISIVTDLDNLFGSRGIYDNPGGAGVGWERPASVEWIKPDGRTGFQVNAGLRIYGGAFRGMGLTRKKTFRLLFKRDYGPTKLRYPLFGDGAVNNLDTIILRGGANDAWNNWGRENTQYTVDEFMRRMQLALGQPSGHGTFAHLYLNGLYWGLYNPCERPQASFAANYFGGDKEDWDALNSGRPVGESSSATWNDMLGLARQGLGSNAAYQHIQGNHVTGAPDPNYVDYLDVENCIDYMFSNFWGGTGDWPHHNWYVACRRPPEATGFKLFNWDSEGAIVVWSNLNANTTGVNNGVAVPYAALRENAEFRLLFADHVHRHLFNNGAATSEVSYARYKELADEVELAIIAESARWGDQSRATPYTLADWQGTRDYILNTYMPQRPAIVLEQLRSADLYPNVDAPAFHVIGAPPQGGHISADDFLYMIGGSGTIYYTLDGSDPRLPTWASAPGEPVRLVAEDAPKHFIVPTGPITGETVKGTILREYWTGISGASVSDLVNSPAYPDNPSGSDELAVFEAPTDWAENYGTRIRGYLHPPTTGDYTFWIASDDGGELRLSTNAMSGNAIKIASVPGWTSSRQWDRYAEQQSAAITLTAGRKYYIEALQKEQGGGDNLAVAWQGPGIARQIIEGSYLSPAGTEWSSISFDDSSWSHGAGIIGYEMNPTDPINYSGLINIDLKSDMRNVNSTCLVRIPFDIGNREFGFMRLKVRYDDAFIAYLNGAEVARRNFAEDPNWDSAASVENPDSVAVVSEPIDISEYVNVLRSGLNILAIHGLNISAGDVDFLIAGELIAHEVSQGDVSAVAVEYAAPFQLSKSTHIKARTLEGRWSALNEATFAVGPVAENLRVTELMYHPQFRGDPNDRNAEYIELKNIGAETINLNLVKFTNGVDFTFPSVELAPGQYVLVVKDASIFEARYGTGLPVAGQYTGSLANNGERIELQDAVDKTIHYFRYRDGWYNITDGDGFSLTIKDPAVTDPNMWGDKSTWRPSANVDGSPGTDDKGQIPELGDVVINELLAHSHAEASDWIELHNTTDNAISIGGWFLSDDSADLTKYEIADDVMIDPQGHVVFTQGLHFGNPSDPGCHVPFALSENGETLYLHSGQDGALTGYSDQERFGASETGVAFGRYRKSTGTYNFVAMNVNTPGSANAYPKVGPVVITEIMYHPIAPADAEYVELLNISDSDVTLYDFVTEEPWKLTDDPDNPGIEFLFPSDPAVVVAAGEYILLVKDLPLFGSIFTVPGGTEIFAWGAGRLDNGGEKVQISMPGDVDAEGVRQYIRVDRVRYSDGSHHDDFAAGVDLWPTGPDGLGSSLSRLFPHCYGNDPNNWQASVPSPGAANP